MAQLLNFLAMLGIIVITVWLYFVVPAQMAASRGRSPVIWVLVSLIFSPLVAIILLALLGSADNTADRP